MVGLVMDNLRACHVVVACHVDNLMVGLVMWIT